MLKVLFRSFGSGVLKDEGDFNSAGPYQGEIEYYLFSVGLEALSQLGVMSERSWGGWVMKDLDL